MPKQDSEDYFESVVSATNPLAHAVVVELPPSADDGPPVSTSYRMTSKDGAEIQWYIERA
jgi:hypothetical protein